MTALRRKRGRPAIVEGTKSAPISTSLPVDENDQFVRLAIRQRLSVSEQLRMAAREYLGRTVGSRPTVE